MRCYANRLQIECKLLGLSIFQAKFELKPLFAGGLTRFLLLYRSFSSNLLLKTQQKNFKSVHLLFFFCSMFLVLCTFPTILLMFWFYSLCDFQGKKVFYHKVIIETPTNKEFVSVKCFTSVPYNLTKTPHNITRRDVLPFGFEEPMYVSKWFISPLSAEQLTLTTWIIWLLFYGLFNFSFNSIDFYHVFFSSSFEWPFCFSSYKFFIFLRIFVVKIIYQAKCFYVACLSLFSF